VGIRFKRTCCNNENREGSEIGIGIFVGDEKSFSKAVQITGTCIISDDLQIENGITSRRRIFGSQQTTCASAQSAPSLKKTEQYVFGRPWDVAQTCFPLENRERKI
jgi:hypothetical protein